MDKTKSSDKRTFSQMSRKKISFNDYLTKEKGISPCSDALILSSSPDEEAYIMVVKNKIESAGDAVTMESLKRFCDVTFLVGPDHTPVRGIREIIFVRSGALQQEIETFENNPNPSKQSLRSKVMHSVNSKLRHLSCGVVRQSIPQSVEIPMETLDAESFRRLMNYIHCGTLIVDASTVIALMHEADMFGFPELLQPCRDYAIGCAVRADNLHDLLVSARKFKDFDTTKALMKEMKQHKDEYPEMAEYEETFNLLTRDECQYLEPPD